MTSGDVAWFVLSLLIRAAVILPLHLVMLRLLPNLRSRLGVGRLKLLWLTVLLPPALFLVPDLFSATAMSGAMSYAAAFGAELGREVMVASSRALPTVSTVVTLLLGVVWAVGALCVVGRRVFDLAVLLYMVDRHTVHIKKRGRITLKYVNGGITSPVTYGLFAPVIVIPVTALEDEVLCHMLVMHEITHIENRDVLMHYITTFLCAVYWFYPPIYRIERELCELSELVCDAEAVSLMPSRKTDYGRMLIAYARHSTAKVGLDSRLSSGGRSLRCRIESLVEPVVVTQKMRRLGTLLLALTIVLSVGVSTFQTMICGTRELTFNEVIIEVPGYLGVFRAIDGSVVFTLAGREVGRLMRLRSYVDFDAFYKMFDNTSIYVSSPTAQYDGDYLRGEFTRHGRNGSFFLYTDERLGTRSSYALCLYDAPMMGLFSMVEMARSVENRRIAERPRVSDKLTLTADINHFLSQ